ATDEARLAALIVEAHDLDEAYVADLKQTAARLAEKRQAIWDKLRQAHATRLSLSPGLDTGFDRYGVAGALPRENEAELVAAAETLEAVGIRERAKAQPPMQPNAVLYRPPRDPLGIGVVDVDKRRLS